MGKDKGDRSKRSKPPQIWVVGCLKQHPTTFRSLENFLAEWQNHEAEWLVADRSCDKDTAALVYQMGEGQLTSAWIMFQDQLPLSERAARSSKPARSQKEAHSIDRESRWTTYFESDPTAKLVLRSYLSATDLCRLGGACSRIACACRAKDVWAAQYVARFGAISPSLMSFSHFRARHQAETMPIRAQTWHPSHRETYTFVLAIDNEVEPAEVLGRHAQAQHWVQTRELPEIKRGYTLDKDYGVVPTSAVFSGFTEVTAMVGGNTELVGNAAWLSNNSQIEADRFQLEIVQDIPFCASAETFVIDFVQGALDLNAPAHMYGLATMPTGSASLTVIRHSDGAANYVGKLKRFEETDGYEHFVCDQLTPGFAGIDSNQLDANAKPTCALFGFENCSDGIVVNSESGMVAALKRDASAHVLQFFVSVPTSGNVSSAQLMARVSTVQYQEDIGHPGEMYLDVQEIWYPSHSAVLCMLEERAGWRS